MLATVLLFAFIGLRWIRYKEERLLVVRRYINGAIIRLDTAAIADNIDNEDINNPERDFNDLWDLPPQQENQLLTEEERLNAVPLHGGDEEEELQFDDIRQALNNVDINEMYEVRSEQEENTILHVIANSLAVLPNITEHNDDCPCNICRRLKHSHSLLEIVIERLAQADMFYELMRKLNNLGITPLRAAAQTDYALVIKVMNLFQCHLSAEEVNGLLAMQEGDGRNVFIYLAERNIWSLIKFLKTFGYEQRLHLLELLNPYTINYVFEDHEPEQELINDDAREAFLHPFRERQHQLQLIEHARHVIQQRPPLLDAGIEQDFVHRHEIIEQQGQFEVEVEEEELQHMFMHEFQEVVHLPHVLHVQLPDAYENLFRGLQEHFGEVRNAQHLWQPAEALHWMNLKWLLEALIPPEMLVHIVLPWRLTIEVAFEILEHVRILYNFNFLPGRDLDDEPFLAL